MAGNSRTSKPNYSQLDLHGVKHQEVERLVENFILTNQDSFPLKVICGNSVKMIGLVNSTIDNVGCVCEMYQFGVIIIYRFT